MGKHDADEGLGFFLGGAEAVKNCALWFVKNIKVVFIVALIPIIGFGSYQLAKYIANNKKKNTEPTYALAGNIITDENKEKEFYMRI